MTTMHENYYSDVNTSGTKTVLTMSLWGFNISFFSKGLKEQLLSFKNNCPFFLTAIQPCCINCILGIVMLLGIEGSLQAQASMPPEPQPAQLTLKPINTLVESAIQNAPALKANRNDVARQTIAWKMQKRSWADIVSLTASTLYGNGSVVDATNTGASTAYVLSNKQNLSSNIGVTIRLNGSDFITRGSKAEMQKLQLERLKNDQEQIEMVIRDNVTTLYTQLELALKIVQLKSEALETQRMALSVAEKYYKEGNSQPIEFSGMLSKVTSAEEQYEQAKSDSKKLVYLLKNLVGDTIWE